MSEPKPIEYELEDGDTKPPESEAESIARLQREDEEKARAIGLVKEKHSSKTGKKWMDSIGGNSANATASRLLEQEARAAERKRQARAAATKLVAMLIVGLIMVGGGAAVACDYMGVVDLGIFVKPAPEVTTKAAERLASRPEPAADVAPATDATAPKSAIKVLGVIGEATPLDNPPSEAPPARDSREPAPAAPAVPAADLRRLEKRLEGAQSAVDNHQGDLAEKGATIAGHLKALYGIVPSPRDVVPDRSAWRAPCAMIELEQAYAAPKTSNNAVQWSHRTQNAQVQVNNLNAYLKHDRGVEKDITARLKKAERERDAAKEALEAAKR